VAILVTLWSLGLLSGAVHPLGYMAALLGLALTTWCGLALGLYGSLWSTDTKQATNVVALPVMFALLSAMAPLLLPTDRTSVMFGVFSPPWHTYIALVSFEDVRDAFRPGPYATVAALGVHSGEGVGALAATYLVGLCLELVAALWFTRACLLDFDAAVGRPIRTGRLDPVEPATLERAGVVGPG
jgi:hypothetical protein